MFPYDYSKRIPNQKLWALFIVTLIKKILNIVPYGLTIIEKKISKLKKCRLLLQKSFQILEKILNTFYEKFGKNLKASKQEKIQRKIDTHDVISCLVFSKIFNSTEDMFSFRKIYFLNSDKKFLNQKISEERKKISPKKNQR